VGARKSSLRKTASDNKSGKIKDNTMSGQTGKSATYVVLVIVSLIAVPMVLTSTSRYGPGLSSDAICYISAARHLLDGKGFLSYDGEPYTHWPPLFPALLALLGLAGLEPVTGARFLNATSFALVVFCSGVLFAKRIRSPLLIISGAFAVLVSATMLRISVYAWTEPLFALLTILFILSLVRFLSSKKLTLLILTGIFAALACLQRYVGIPIVIAGVVSIMLFMHRCSWWEKIKYSVVFGFISSAGLGLWFVRNKLVSPTGAAYHFSLDTTVYKEITETLNSLTPWFVTDKISLSSRLVIIMILICFLSAAVILRNRKFGKEHSYDKMLIKAIITLIVIHTFFTMAAAVFANADADYRLFSSIYVFVILFFLIGFEAVGKLLGVVFGKEWAGYLVIAVLIGIWLLFYPLPIVKQRVRSHREHGVPGYNSVIWHRSPVINWLKGHKLEGRIFSNEPHAVYFHVGTYTKFSPRRSDDVESFRRLMSLEQNNYLLWYHNNWRKNACNLQEINSMFKLKLLRRMQDGVVLLME
jgi:hypothetical protein